MYSLSTSMDESKRKTLRAEDRISTLPDDVICHILSLLETIDAVRTSVLSTRWRYLFASVAVLRFYAFPNLTESREGRFIDFVYRVLNRHDVPDIDLFDLELGYGCYENSDVNSWIYSAIRRNVRNIKVVVCNVMLGSSLTICKSLVPDLFSCKTLADLFLRGAFELRVPESVCLPNLKTCSVGIKFIDNGSVERLFSSCPKLENLTFWECDMRDLKDVELHIPSLKMFHFFGAYSVKILLNAPNLEYFEHIGGGPNVLCNGVWKSIVRANIGLIKGHKLAEENMPQLVNNLIEVKYLSLFYGSMELLHQSCSLLPMFDKLTHLELQAESNAGWKLLPTLLHRAPCLEVLVIHRGFDDDYVFDKITESFPICLSRQLKVAMIHESDEDQAEFKWIKFLLKTAIVLEKLIVFLNSPKTVENRYQWRDQIREELLTFPKISEKCQVVIAKQDKYLKYGRAF